ncbi:TPA_asm: L [Hepatica betacytorhabdovirus 1]|nr:TPA_asm: L [Hepatica betacytorhabdovirus 1]
MDEDEIRRTAGLGDFHLRSALSKIDMVGLRSGQGRKREQRAFNVLSSKFDVSEVEPCRILVRILDEIKNVPEKKIPYLSEVIDLLEIERNGLNWMTSPDDIFGKAVDILKNDPPTTSYTAIRHKLQVGLMYLLASTSGREFPIDNSILSIFHNLISIEIGSTILILSGDIVGVSHISMKSKEHGVRVKIITLDAYRMVVDKVTERENVLIMSEIGFPIIPEVYLPTHVIEELFGILDEHLKNFGNSGYQLLKSYEALILGLLLKIEDSDIINTEDFFISTKSALGHENFQTVEKIEDLVSRYCHTPHHYTQLIGLFRLWGHPEVVPKEGLLKVKKIGKSDKEGSLSMYNSDVIARKFKEILSMNYFKKHHRYPSIMHLDEVKENYVLDCILKNEMINKLDIMYHPSDWDEISFDQTFQTPITFNLSMIVADTAISPTREELYESKKIGGRGMDASIRRGVLKWIKDGVVDCKKLLDDINDNPQGLDINELCIGLYPKEREMNPIPRMFALMTLLMRSYIVITENMLSDNVLDYIPGITMTFNLLQLSKEMIGSTQRQRGSKHFSKTFCINMDFEKWNLNMRKSATYPLFAELGKLFGLEHIYNRTYDIFEKSIIYLADGSYIPSINPDLSFEDDGTELSYIGHMGGFEGLRQKGWTIFTVVTIAKICDDLGIDYKLMGQGDNQVLMVTVHSEQARGLGIDSLYACVEIKSKVDTLLTSLEKTFGTLGLPLKPLETWISECFFAYGKFPIYRGLPCVSSYKRISRVFAFSNEDLMTVTNAMGAITANAQSCSMSDIHPAISYVIAKWQHLLCIGLFMKYHPLIGGPPFHYDDIPSFRFKTYNGHRLSFSSDRIYNNSLIRKAMVTVPKTLGGYNSICYFDMIMRGFPDPPTKDMQFMYLMAQNSTGLFSQILINFISVQLSDDVDYKHLLQDPVSLNLLLPPSSTTIIKKMVRKSIGSLNHTSEFALWFKEVLEINDDEGLRPLCDKLTEPDKLNIRFLHDILGSTLYGYTDSITSKIDKTVTLSRMSTGTYDVVGVLVKGEIRFWNYFLWRMDHSGGEYIDWECPSRYIRTIRDKGWKKRILGISTPFPFHFLMETDGKNRKLYDSYVEAVIGEHSLGNQNKMFCDLGNSLPYLGSITKEKISSMAARVAYGTEPLISRPVRLLRAVGWFIKSNSNWELTLRRILSAVTDLDANEVIYIPEAVKGSMTHRYSDLALKHGSLWMNLYGPATYVSLSTNTFTEYAKGSKNVTIHFQALLCLLQYFMINQALSSRCQKHKIFYKSCEYCITPVDEVDDDILEPIDENLIPSQRSNPYLFVKSENIKLLYSKNLYHLSTILKAGLLEVMEDENLGRRLLEEIVGSRLALSWIGTYAFDEDYGLQDIYGISRTIYLKIFPSNVLAYALKYYWIYTRTTKEISRFNYPSWTASKRSFIRRLQGLPLSSFRIFGGFYLWDESLELLKRERWAAMPLSYPFTPNSITVASKQTVVTFAETLRNIICPHSGIIHSDQSKLFVTILKDSLLYNSMGLPRHTCQACIAIGLTCKINVEVTYAEMSLVKCMYDHNVFHEVHWNCLRRIESDLDSLADKVSKLISLPLPENNIPRIREHMNHSRLIFNNRMIIGYSTDKLPLRDFEYTSPEFQSFQLRLKMSIPTRALYRIYDILEDDFFVDKNSGLIVLGDGYGYSSLISQALMPERRISSWTMIDTTSAVPHSLYLTRPPTHLLYNSQIDCSNSIYSVSDIQNPLFKEQMSKLVEMGYNYVLSEIEFWYEGGNTDYYNLVRTLWSCKVKRGIIKITVMNLKEIISIMEFINNFYENWDISETPTVFLARKEVWLKMSNRRSTGQCNNRSFNRNTLRSLEERLISHLNSSLDFSDRFSELREEFWHDMEIQFAGGPIDRMINQIMTSWMSDAGLTSWRGESFTPLLYEIKTGRRPIGMKNLEGNSMFYYFRDHDETLFTRLFCLAMSLVQEVHEIWNEFSQNDYCWSMEWRSAGVYEGSRLSYYYNPVLFKTRTSLYWTERLKKEIYKNIGPMRWCRHHLDNPFILCDIGSEIRFEYLGSRLFFPITKISAYRVAK